MNYHIYNILRLLLYPFVRFVLPLVSRKAKTRLEFELKNHIRKAAVQKADVAFEVSSEGEYEQVYALIDKVLTQGKSVEILYCSESVEHRIQELQRKYPEKVRAFILPILSYFPYGKTQNPVDWLSADLFYLCRYDFFPELIFYGVHRCRNFVLLSASLKNFENKNTAAKFYIKACLKKFHKIVAVSQTERQKIVQQVDVNMGKVEVFDFRTIQIQKRIKNLNGTLQDKWPLALKLKDQVNDEDVIFGSYWPEDFEIVKELIQDRKVYLAPHHLDQKSLNRLEQQLRAAELSYKLLTTESGEEDLKESMVTIINVKGLLCELYSFFKLSYVGGGFGQSVHSVLEPYMAGCKVLTGPNIYRSSEVDMIKEFDPEMIYDFNNVQQIVASLREGPPAESRSESFKDHFLGHFDPIVTWTGIESC